MHANLTTPTAITLATTFMPYDNPVVFVVDDDISVRQSMEILLRSAGLRSEVFGSASEFLAHPRMLAPACLVLDVNLPDISGLEVQMIVSAERSVLPIIFITGYGNVPMTANAMKSGAVDFLMKPVTDETLLEAIERALKQSAESIALAAEMRVLQDRYAKLSRREREVMALVVAGLLNKSIAYELGISEITVKAHRRQVMQKMNANCLPLLVRIATRLGQLH